MTNIPHLLAQGVALARTPLQQARVEYFAEKFSKRLSSINALLDQGDKDWKDLEDIRSQTEEVRECTKRGILWTGKDAIRRSLNPLFEWNECEQAWIKKA